jgi:DNA ligase 1
MSDFKPMLSATVDDATKLRFPLLASNKLDGIRATVLNGVLVSRNLKAIPNAHVQALFGRPELEGLDGELIVGDPADPAAFRLTSSAVMSHEGEPAVTFYIFDLVIPDFGLMFSARLAILKAKLKELKRRDVKLLDQATVHDQAELDAFETLSLDQGYEGVMLRDPQGLYKHGRSTFKEHWLMKLKRFEDAEAEVVGFEEQMHNTNEAKTNALGHKERSTKKVGMVGKGTLGALRVVGVNGTYKGVEFNIGTGFDDALRAEIWANQPRWQGALVKFKYFPSGSKEAPRFPVYLGQRSKRDM